MHGTSHKGPVRLGQSLHCSRRWRGFGKNRINAEERGSSPLFVKTCELAAATYQSTDRHAGREVWLRPDFIPVRRLRFFCGSSSLTAGGGGVVLVVFLFQNALVGPAAPVLFFLFPCWGPRLSRVGGRARGPGR